MPGFFELLVLLVILVIVFGAKRLPRLGEALGRAVVKYRQASRSRSDVDVQRVPVQRVPAEGVPAEAGPAEGGPTERVVERERARRDADSSS